MSSSSLGRPGHPEQDDRDVVLTAGLVRRLDEPLARLLEVARTRDEVPDLLVVDHRGQPVGADEEKVVALGLRP